MNSESLQQQATQLEPMPVANQGDEMLNRIGHVTRLLHDSLQGLGLDKILEQVAQDIPDARDRLAYVSRMTEQAAERVLNATDLATPLQTELANGASALEISWKEVLEKPSLKREYNQIADETLEFLTLTVKNTTETKALLMDIMMAQDFQDLTGQVIKKITGLAQDLERQLVQVLVDFSPATAKKEKENDDKATLMNGPQIDATAVDVVASQEQVDDLLDSLGF
ncbi:protein phosphatase CheZ [Methylotenera sp.]|uniref:protein phosphatase CheZ n=1 Tax=Methylotenera sp. TaxID=2051956 RepID=UPI002489A662|nr:protein phosphatase CheZ [Methylotenera sp.]MDI1299429.1 protein phosphatase CheZ [Methylotenera sp.]